MQDSLKGLIALVRGSGGRQPPYAQASGSFSADSDALDALEPTRVPSAASIRARPTATSQADPATSVLARQILLNKILEAKIQLLFLASPCLVAQQQGSPGLLQLLVLWHAQRRLDIHPPRLVVVQSRGYFAIPRVFSYKCSFSKDLCQFF